MRLRNVVAEDNEWKKRKETTAAPVYRFMR